MKKVIVWIATLSLVTLSLAVILSGCGTSSSTPSTSKSSSKSSTSTSSSSSNTTSSSSTSTFKFPQEPAMSASLVNQELAGNLPASVKAELDSVSQLRMGEKVPGYPNGVKPVAPSAFKFSASDIAKLKAGHYTAGIAMHVMDAAWPKLQEAGIKTTLAKFGIKVVSVTNANMKPNKQVDQVDTMIARHPSVIFSIPIDPSEASTYKKVAKAGIKLVFMDNVPPGMTPGKDYTSVCSSNNEGNAIFAAQNLVKLVGPNAKIGSLTLGNFYWSVTVRVIGLNQVLKQYPNIKQYAQTFTDTTHAYGLATSMLTAHPDITGIWAAWNTPAESVVAAEKALGKHIIITTCDLGPVSALEIAQGYIQADGAQLPYNQGCAEADAAAYALLGKTAPPYVEVPTVPVTRADLIPAYMEVMHQKPPANVIKALESPTIAG